MAAHRKCLHVCDCNRTMAIDPGLLSRALKSDQPVTVHHGLCRQEAGAFTASLQPGAAVVTACTQEAPLFRELAEQAGFDGSLEFLNIRELAGWSAQAAAAQPKIAALLARAHIPEPEPVAAVSYRSAGDTLIIGPLEAALAWGRTLAESLQVTVLATDARGELPAQRAFPVAVGRDIRVQGHLGAFEVSWREANPIDLTLCTRCNACIRACPEAAIDFSYQIDLDRCRDHRACVRACGSIGAIDFDRGEQVRSERFDLVLDLSPEPLIRLPHPPQGYLAPGRDALDQSEAARKLLALVGEFEKPRYFNYKASICAHSRNAIEGCNRCIDVCSTGAIAADGNGVKVDPHLCMGCGGCATVCPTGAMRYAYPRVPEQGVGLKTVLQTYAAAGGRDACLLFHAGADTLESLMALGRRGKGLPARVIPFEVHSVAALGLDLLLAAIAYGASECVILSPSEEPEGYVEATRAQLGLGQTILGALGYRGEHLRLLQAEDWPALEREAWAWQAAQGVAAPAAFALTEDKRTTLELALEHLARHAPAKRDEIPLPAGAPWGTVNLDKDKCTLCLSCVGACPASALMDSPDYPRLKFVERNCVQCGLCVATCPEDALSLTPRLLLTPEVRRERVLNEAEPFHCVKCGKPFGTRQMVDAMSARLTGHSMFAGGDALRRLQMCADCRVLDMMEHKGGEMTVFDL